MKIAIRGQGDIKSIFAQNQLQLDLPENITVSELRQYLKEFNPRFNEETSYVIVVNDELVYEDKRLSECDKVNIVSPISGG